MIFSLLIALLRALLLWHISLSVAPADQCPVLSCVLYKIQVELEEEKHVNKYAIFYVTFSQLESWMQKQLQSLVA